MSTDTIDEAMLFAYIDGELDLAQRARVEAAVARDPQLAARLAAHQRLKAQLQAQFGAILDEPIPERLLRAVASPVPATVTDIRTARVDRVRPGVRRWSLPTWGAVAATLVLGVLIGMQLRRGGDAPLRASEEGLLASGPLAAALSNLPAGPAQDAAASIGISIRTVAGEYCRSFSLQSGPAGLACRRNEQWVVDVLANGEPQSGRDSFRTAGSAMPEALRRSIEQRMAGDPLTEADELTQIRRKWQAQTSSFKSP